mgnify:CR=1 FL=1
MRISTQNNQFVFNFPIDFIDLRIEERYLLIFEKNMIQYESVIDYLNSTIKEIVFPSVQYTQSEQTLRRGKVVGWKDAKSVFDNFTNELDITFRSVDSSLNYFIMLDVLNEFILNNDKEYIPYFQLHILDKDGDTMFTVTFEEILLKSLSENRFSYNLTDISEKTFSVTFRYNFIKIDYMISDKTPIQPTPIIDIPINQVDDRYIQR